MKKFDNYFNSTWEQYQQELEKEKENKQTSRETTQDERLQQLLLAIETIPDLPPMDE